MYLELVPLARLRKLRSQYKVAHMREESLNDRWSHICRDTNGTKDHDETMSDLEL